MTGIRKPKVLQEAKLKIRPRAKPMKAVWIPGKQVEALLKRGAREAQNNLSKR
jgi:hypothetical protein